MKHSINASIGVNPITWSNDDLPHVGGEISLETCLADAAAAGYAGIELGGKFPRDPGRLAPLHVQRARYRRRAQRHHVDFGPHLL